MDDTESEVDDPERTARIVDQCEKAMAAMSRGDHVAAAWYFYGVGPKGTRPADCK